MADYVLRAAPSPPGTMDRAFLNPDDAPTPPPPGTMTRALSSFALVVRPDAGQLWPRPPG